MILSKEKLEINFVLENYSFVWTAIEKVLLNHLEFVLARVWAVDDWDDAYAGLRGRNEVLDVVGHVEDSIELSIDGQNQKVYGTKILAAELAISYSYSVVKVPLEREHVHLCALSQ